ncbi:unnamed protein product [Hyaloperonospora brassicae]|uniref:Glycosyltransferase 61 catalytic domain-containing protein n=1 Tax=Hyaloperonospora brassicae TaxID=162125 RepID=A0AAV0TIW9_HYABA|nr:unnamed protein product [Hyaloperonospora brassicae]
MAKDGKRTPAVTVQSHVYAFCRIYRRQLHTLVLVAILLSIASMMTRIMELSTASGGLYGSQSARSVLRSESSDGYAVVLSVAGRGSQRPEPHVARADSTTSITERAAKLSVAQQAPLKFVVEQPTRPPYVYESNKTRDECYARRDMGIFDTVRRSARTFCANGGWDGSKLAPVSANQATKVSTYRIAKSIRSATFQNLMLDFVNVSIKAPIKSIKDDGGGHDPRFQFNMKLVNCACDEFASYYRNELSGYKERKYEMLWHPHLMPVPKRGIPNPLICSERRPKATNRSAWDFVNNPLTAPDDHETVVFEDPVVLMARHDDHNPFFQLSNALNAWIMLTALEWDTAKTRVIHLDAGYPSPYDALQRVMLGPNYEIIDGATLIGKRVHFRGDVLLSAFESSGPLMEHLGKAEPCYDSELLKTFRAQSLLKMNITPEVERGLGVSRIRPMYVTVITRRPYLGRKLQRIWVNEDEVMAKMRKDYKDLNVEFRSIDYVNITLHEQMKLTIESDMVVGMHGAGLVNVIWTRPMTTVVEIFPKKKRRYGYRNICQLVGCDWHEFRGGKDIGGGLDPNSKNKRIPYAEWKTYFHPVFQQAYDAYEERQAVLHGQAL